MTKPMLRLIRKENITPRMHITGTGSIICTKLTKACCMTLMSLSVRVIIDAVPKFSKSDAEKSSDLL